MKRHFPESHLVVVLRHPQQLVADAQLRDVAAPARQPPPQRQEPIGRCATGQVPLELPKVYGGPKSGIEACPQCTAHRVHRNPAGRWEQMMFFWLYMPE